MNGFKYLLCTICIFAVVFECGCVIRPAPIRVVDVEGIVEIDFGPPPAPATVIVSRPRRPSKVHIWIDGHHVVRSGRWVWVKGHWAKPQRGSAVWVPDHARRRGKAWRWTPGHWR